MIESQTVEKKVTCCRVCNSKIEPFMSFGKMPIANGFLTADQLASEYFFELAPAFCSHCGTFQLMKQPAPERMFHENYAFFFEHIALHANAFQGVCGSGHESDFHGTQRSDRGRIGQQ